jgi:hypothetical protein
MKFIKSQNKVPSTSRIFDAWFRTRAYSCNQFVYNLPDTPTKIWYENRDGYHAGASGFENIIELTTPDISQRITSWAINVNETYKNGIVISNSSTAKSPTETGGSNTRTPDNGWSWWMLIRENWELGTIQFFPEHGDYDGLDWFKINQPYIVTTQGSSGTEIGELGRCREIVSALTPGVRQWLIENKRVGDVVSYLMRSNTRFDYLDAVNHRVVIDGWNTTQADIDLAKSLTVETLPPRLSLHVVSDSNDVRNANGFPLTSTIRTPELAGFQRLDGTKTRTIEVEVSSDKPCEIHWIKSQGVCTITYQSQDKRKATITIPYQCEFPVQTQSGEIVSNRVEVIAVGYDGTHYSSPVFITEYFTPESREFRKKMNEIAVHADNVFTLRLNGEEILRGDNWQIRYQKRDIAFKESNLIEAEVTNLGGPGGLLAELFVGETKYVADDSWECSLDGKEWVKPVVIPHEGSVWQPQSNIDAKLNWIWHPQAIENSKVYFRKTIGAAVPPTPPQPPPQPPQPPQPTPVPPSPPETTLEARVLALEETLSKIKEALK